MRRFHVTRETRISAGAEMIEAGRGRRDDERLCGQAARLVMHMRLDWHSR